MRSKGVSKLALQAGMLLLLILSTVTLVFSSVASTFLARKIVLEKRFQNEDILFAAVSEEMASHMVELYETSGIKDVGTYADKKGFYYVLYSSVGDRIGGNVSVGEESAMFHTVTGAEGLKVSAADGSIYYVKIGWKEGKRAEQEALYAGIYDRVAAHQSLILVLLLLSALAAVFSFLVLLWSLSDAQTDREIKGLGKIPLEVKALIAICLAYFAAKFLDFTRWKDAVYETSQVRVYTAILLITMLFCLYVFRFTRKKDWYHYTICYAIFQGLEKLVKIIGILAENASLIWKALLFFLILSVVEVAVIWEMVPLAESRRIFFLIWAGIKVVVAPLLLYFVLGFRRFEIAAEKMAEGDMSYQLSEDQVPFFLKRFGRSMSNVSDCVSEAVEQRLKSERLKTELITNVSHDIKTPLTSIINYSDLIGREKTDNENIQEYAEILHRQSTRLKKLIEDLMEASKASTGNLEVNLEPCKVNVLLEQCVGEFDYRLNDLDIELIVNACEQSPQILADSRMLWRIFDNLMTNICKYTQPGTRVYLTTKQTEDQVSITFKNVSKYPLSQNASDLLERFVRGDKSRHTEGNGLGLSIAKSLMDLQKGRMELIADGDLFKITLFFDILKSEAPVKE